MTISPRTLLQQALDALPTLFVRRMAPHDRPIGVDAAEAIRAHLAAQPAPGEPVALESVHLTRDIKGMCTVRVNGRVAIQDNGDIIDHMATLEWFAQPAPVPLTDTETHAELWKLAVRKGLITVRSELIDPRNHGTRVSWMQGHDKACDISNDAAAHGIAASPAAPAAPVVPLTEGRITAIANELAFGGGHCNVYELARAIEAAHGITGGKP